MRIETNPHMDEDQIERYSMGAISETESSRLEEHLLICELCQTRVEESDRYISAMQRASAQMRKGAQGSKHRWANFPPFTPLLAAAALILCLTVAGTRLGNRTVVSPVFRLDLTATRGNGIEAKAPAGAALALQLDLAGLRAEPFFRVEIVDRLGKRIWQGDVIPQASKASASVPKLPSGIYFVRANAPSGQLLREYGLEVEGR